SFRPEFLNRVDEVIVFHQLEKEELREIVDLMIGELAVRLKEYGLVIKLTDAAKDHLTDAGYDPTFGARPLRRAIQRQIEDELSEKMLAGEFEHGDLIMVDVADGKLTFAKGTQPSQPIADEDSEA
ncbi:MAG TPA: NDP-hexose 4-ketoreductase, partial [Firmicutes bacterium]|nr:NDP-hexose 4-ketoreductase [Bacillota bacterium]